MRRLAVLIFVSLSLDYHAAHGGAITCSATCLSKIASAVSIAANGKTIAVGAKKIRHPKAKSTKGKKT